MNLVQVKGFGEGIRPKLPSTAIPQPEILIFNWFRDLRTGLEYKLHHRQSHYLFIKLAG